jgi:hypothetical protein
MYSLGYRLGETSLILAQLRLFRRFIVRNRFFRQMTCSIHFMGDFKV